MTTLDIVLLAIAVPAAIAGVYKGFVKQVVAIAALFLGPWIAFKFNAPVADFFAGLFGDGQGKITRIICFAVLALTSIIVINILGGLLTKVIKVATLGWLNILLGALFSILKYAMILMLAIYLFDLLNGKLDLVDDRLLGQSSVYTCLRDAALSFFPYLKSLLTNAPS